MGSLKAAVIPVTPFQQNCAIIWDEQTRRGLIVDPGGEAERILEAVGTLQVQPERILLTHGHLDHAGGAASVRDMLRERTTEAVPVEGPDRRDDFLLRGIAAQAAQYGLEGMQDVAPDRWLAEGDKVHLGPHVFDVLHCPGHTPGHIVFVNRAARFAVLGDVLFQGSIGRTDFPYGDHAALMRAIHEKVLPLGDDIAFLCGHGPGSTIGLERRTNQFLRDAPR